MLAIGSGVAGCGSNYTVGGARSAGIGGVLELATFGNFGISGGLSICVSGIVYPSVRRVEGQLFLEKSNLILCLGSYAHVRLFVLLEVLTLVALRRCGLDAEPT